MKPIDCFIVDDEPGALSGLKKVVQTYPAKLNLIGSAGNYQKALASIRRLKPELVFMDIQLQKDLGIDLVKEEFDRPFEVIFVTAYGNYALDAFKENAVSYLLKPIDFEEFELALERAEKLLRYQIPKGEGTSFHDRIVLPQETGTVYLKVSDLLFAKASGSYCEIQKVNGVKYTISKPLRFLEEQADAESLVRTHRSYLINPDHIKAWDKKRTGHVTLEGDVEIPVSKSGRDILVHLLD